MGLATTIISLAVTAFILFMGYQYIMNWLKNKFQPDPFIGNVMSIKCYDGKDMKVCEADVEKGIYNEVFGTENPEWIRTYDVGKDKFGQIWRRHDHNDGKSCENGFCWVKDVV